MPSAPLRLRCEFVSNPLGVSCARPRLSWWVNDTRPAELQSAYEIIAASSAESLAADEGDLWLSGHVESNNSAHVAYAGANLSSSQRVYWKVRTFDSDGLSSPWSEPAWFEMGLLDESDWQAHWIAAPLRGSRSRGVHAVALRREFLLTQEVAFARLYVAALGDYRLEVNGVQLPGSECNALWSDFDRQIYYQTYDVTSLLLAEPNAIGVLLADGYYAGYLPGVGRANYGDRPQLLLHLVVMLADGKHYRLTSDHQWHWQPSWVLAAETNGGEHVDARQYNRGWSEAGFDERQWAPVDVLAGRAAALLSQPYPAFAIQQVLRPLALPHVSRKHGRVKSIYDFGDQVMGRARVDLFSNASDDVVLTYSLDDSFDESCSDTYTSNGETAGESFEAMFALHAFRFLAIEFTGGVTEIKDVYALRVAAPESASLSFRCDHPSLNQLFESLHNSTSAVALSVPMRGAEQQQRLPDVGYASTWVPFFAQQERAHALVGKWLADIKLACQTGVDSSPYVPAIERATAAVEGDEFARFETLARTLWSVYRHQNDRQILLQCYAELRVGALSYRHKFADLLRARDSDEAGHVGLYGDDYLSGLIATCTMYGALRIAGRIAGVLTHLADYELIEALAEDVRKAFRRRYLTNDGHLPGDSQSVFTAALYHNLLDDSERELAQTRLVELLQNNNYHVDVVPAVLHALLPVLTNAGRLDMAYMVLLQTSAPSWMATVNAGGRLLGREPGVFDIANAGLWEWLMESLVGLALHEDYSIDRNGFSAVRVRPMPPLGKQFLAGSPVQFVEASLDTLHGRYEVNWWIKEDCFELELLVPPGCTALVTMPDDIEQRVASGHHRFVMDFGAGGDGVPTLLNLAQG